MALIFNDIESKNDYLGYMPYIKAFSYIIKSKEEYFNMPLVIGIHGKWGSGKSTFMNLLIKEIDNNFFYDREFDDGNNNNSNNNFKIIKINSWKFDMKTDFLTTLFLEIYKSIKYDSLFSNFPELKIKFGEFIRSIEGNISIPIDPFGSKLSLKKSKVKESVFERNLSSIKRDYIEELIEHKYFSNQKFIIFIDDLDRCSIENIVETIEDIKLSLHSMKCVFFLGCDLEYLKSAIGIKYKDVIEFKAKLNANDIDQELNKFCNEYLEKIVQIPFNIPYLDSTNMNKYLNSLIWNNNEIECKIENFEEEKIKISIEEDMENLKSEIDILSILFFKLKVSARKIKRIFNQAFLHNIFIKFNCINNEKDIDSIKPDLTLLILLLILKDMNTKFYNNNFWSLESAKSFFEKLNLILTDHERLNENNYDEEIPIEFLDFCLNLLERRKQNKLDIKDNELEKYLNVTNTIDFKAIEPEYFNIKSDTNTNTYVRDFCLRNNRNKEMMLLISYFFEEIYDKQIFCIGVSTNIMIYKKDSSKSLKEKFLFSFIGGMQSEGSYFKLKYRGLKCCIDTNFKESIAINKDNIEKIKAIIEELVRNLKENINEN